MLELPGSAGRPRTSIGRCFKAPLGFNNAEYESIKAVASSCQATPLMLLTCALQVISLPCTLQHAVPCTCLQQLYSDIHPPPIFCQEPHTPSPPPPPPPPPPPHHRICDIYVQNMEYSLRIHGMLIDVLQQQLI